MLPDLRVVLGSIFAAFLLVTASIGMLASVRVAQDAIDPLARTSLSSSRSGLLAPRDSAADGKRAEQIAALSRNPLDLTASIPDASVDVKPVPNAGLDKRQQNDAIPQALTEPEPAVPSRQGSIDNESDRRPQSEDVANNDQSPPNDSAPAPAASAVEPATSSAADARAVTPAESPAAAAETTASVPVDATALPKARPAAADLTPKKSASRSTHRAKPRSPRLRSTRNRVRTAAGTRRTAATWPQYQSWQQPQWQNQSSRRRKTTATPFLLGPQ